MMLIQKIYLCLLVLNSGSFMQTSITQGKWLTHSQRRGIMIISQQSEAHDYAKKNHFIRT